MAKGESNEPKEWRRGAEAADRARGNVADQLSELITERSMTGAEQLFARRLREFAQAQRQGDRVLARAALMEALISGALWVAAMDLKAMVLEEA